MKAYRKRYADNGILLDDLNYEKGKLHESAKYFNVEGKLIYWGDYENAEKIGKWETQKLKKELLNIN